MLERRLRRERREWLERAKNEERKEETRRRRDLLFQAYEKDLVVPKEIRYEIEENRLTTDEAIEEAIYGYCPDEKEDEFTSTTIPRPVITTSRDPSNSLVRFTKALKYILPNAEKINRGKQMIKDLVKMAIKNEYTDLIMLNEHKGVPASMIITHLPHGPTTYFSLHHVNMEGLEPISTSIPAVVFDNLTTPLGQRLKRILSSLFPPLAPREKPKRVVSFINREDSILFMQHKTEFTNGIPALTPLTPSFSMRLYEIRAGTLDMTYAEKEFVFRPYMNSTRKKLYLGEDLAIATEESTNLPEEPKPEERKPSSRHSEHKHTYSTRGPIKTNSTSSTSSKTRSIHLTY
ncbi:U3 small nucleolar ribonucleoprotein IMP4 [Nematocida sp. AWRm80]|nr:U3 small nucleolar ribonucleoprotein IMP4 [Nematocida sp. AWRm80]